MRRIIQAAFAALFLGYSVSSACAESAWELIVPTLERGDVTSIQVLPGGDLLVAGSASLSTRAFTGAWLARLSPNGDEVWSKEFLGEAHSQISQVLVEQENIYLVGSHMVHNPTQADSSGIVAMLSLDGDVRWERWLSERRASINGASLSKLSDGSVLVNSVKRPRKGSHRGPHYSKVDAEGEIIWSYTSIPTGTYFEDLPPLKTWMRDSSGSQIYFESPGPVVEQPNGNIHLYIYRDGVFPGESHIGRCEVISKRGELLDDEECNELEHVIGATKAELTPYEIAPVLPGLVLAKQIEVSKIDGAGDVEWTWNYQTKNRAGLTNAVLTPDGGLIGVGFVILEDAPKYHGYDAIVFRLNQQGEEVWSHIYSSETRDIFADLVALENDHYAIVGHTGIKASKGWWDPWIIKIDPDGLSESVVSRR